jgi:hypothetical protein
MFFLCDYVKISWSNIYLLQTLYAGTVRFNILLGATKPKDQVTQEELEAACRDANILDFVHSLPNGFDTEVGGKGSQLSGGQKRESRESSRLLSASLTLMFRTNCHRPCTAPKSVYPIIGRGDICFGQQQ